MASAMFMHEEPVPHLLGRCHDLINRIFAEFNDGYTIQTFSLPCLVALYQQTQDEEIFVAAADILGVGVEEVRGLLEG